MSSMSATRGLDEKGVPSDLRGNASDSPAGPISTDEASLRPEPPTVTQPRWLQRLRYSQRQAELMLKTQRRLGDVFGLRAPGSGLVVVSHPDHIRSLLTAKPEQAQRLTAAPLRAVVGSNSILAAIGSPHLRQRKRLLPGFHGKAIDQYIETTRAVTEREIDNWPVGKPFALVPRMRLITLETTLAAVFGLEGPQSLGAPGHWLRMAFKAMSAASALPLTKASDVLGKDAEGSTGLIRAGLYPLDLAIYAAIRDRRRAGDFERSADVLSVLLGTADDQGQPMSDSELRDELLTLFLAGHETTANSLAWACERLTQNPPAYEALRTAVKQGDPTELIDATLFETLRTRPVIAGVWREVMVPWRLGDYAVPPGTVLELSAVLLHHRADLYPDPFRFHPERWLGVRKPGTYEWLPFGGGVTRCLGSGLAMAQQRVVLEAIARRLDLEAADLTPDRIAQRNVTFSPARGARVVIRSRNA